MKKSKRDNFYDSLMGTSFNSCVNNQMLLQQLQHLNLLCDNEVRHYDKPHYVSMPDSELYTHIQERVAYHRSEELKIKNSYIKKGGFVRLGNGSRVQGTTVVGGLQPDYIIDTTSREIQSFLHSVSVLKNQTISTQIEEVGNILRQEYIAKTQYDDPKYLALLTKYREAELEIPLSEYLKIGRGVCREVSMLTSLALNHLGLESYYYYAKVRTDFGTPKEEDHAVVAISINNEFLISDNYFRMFNLKKLKELENPDGTRCASGLMYDSSETVGRACIVMSRLYPETRHRIT